MSALNRRSKRSVQSASTAGPRQAGAVESHLTVRDARGAVTHVLVPIGEYQALVETSSARRVQRPLDGPSEEAIREAAAIFTSKTTKWIDANKVFAELMARGLAETRKELGLTQAELGKKVGLPQSRISKIESNPDAITLRLVKRLAAALARTR